MNEQITPSVAGDSIGWSDSPFKLRLRAYEVLCKPAGQSEISTENVVVGRHQALLAEFLGLNIQDYIAVLGESAGYEVLHVREEFEDIELPLDTNAILST